MPKPTITVTADPDALRAAMEALEAFKQAQEAYESAEATALEELEAARRAYGEKVAAAQSQLDQARAAAAAAGVDFGPAPGRRTARPTAARRTRTTISYDEAMSRLPSGDFTARDLAETLDCSLPTAIRFAKQGVRDGRLTEKGTRSSGRGRAAQVYGA